MERKRGRERERHRERERRREREVGPNGPGSPTVKIHIHPIYILQDMWKQSLGLG